MTGRIYTPADFPVAESAQSSRRRSGPRSEPEGGARPYTGPLDCLDEADWPEILEPAGWTYVKDDADGHQLWMRPGGADSDYSMRCFTNRPLCINWSEASGLPVGDGEGMNKGQLWAHLHHGGDLSEAARDLLAAARGDAGTPAAQALPDAVLKAVHGLGPTRLKTEDSEPDTPVLPFQWFDELAAEVDNAPPVTWLIRNIWPSGDYGVLSAEPKAQKTWTALDLAVSVATGTRWLGYKHVDTSGPVVVFVGEGGKRNTVRRIRALAAERGHDGTGLRIAVCARAPHLRVAQHLIEVEAKVAATKPALVIIDPLYLAARGADLRDLYGMGAVLENIQVIAQRYGASLMFVHHFGRDKNKKGAERNAGAGPQEWARVLLSVEVVSRKNGARPGETDVVTALDVQGGEVPDQRLRIHRRIWADDPDDLSSPMHVVTSVTEGESETVGAGSDEVQLGKGEVKLLDALVKVSRPAEWVRVIDAMAGIHGHGLHEKTVKKYLSRFLDEGWVDHEPFTSGDTDGKRWFITDAGKDLHNRRSEGGAGGSA